jgi:hypothetical protein
MTNERDDFSQKIKDLLAKRVGFKCSNPGCSRVTSGPQADPNGAINIGVAAHITAAAADGPRYDASLTIEQRTDGGNGIWLCQTCAKLIDSDMTRYTVAVIREWKELAETSAQRDLENRLERFPSQRGIFERLERLIPDLLAEMRHDLEASPLKREFIIMKRSWSYWADPDNPPLAYYYDDHPNLVDQIRQLEGEQLVREITYNNTKRYLISERLADYLGAP